MELHRLGKIPAGLLLLFFYACSDGDTKDVYVPANVAGLEVEQSEVFLKPGSSENILITSGNGEYTTFSSDGGVAVATIVGDALTISAAAGIDNSEALITLRDKYHQSVSIIAHVAKVFDIKLSKENILLNALDPAKKTMPIKVFSGNGDYSVTVEKGTDLIAVNCDNIGENNCFLVTAIAPGNAEVKVTDALGKEARLKISIYGGAPALEDSEINIEKQQGTYTAQIYASAEDLPLTVVNSDPSVAKVSVKGDKLVIQARSNGSTEIVLTNKYGKSSEPVTVTVDGPMYYANLGNADTGYFGHANFFDVSIADPSIKACDGVTYEMVCRVTGYRGGQVFMGLFGNLIIRQPNNDGAATNPFEIAGSNSNLVIRSKSNVPKNRWFHMAIVVDCTASGNDKEHYKLYIDGVEQELDFQKMGTKHTSVNLASSESGNRFTIGRQGTDSWRALHGDIYEARVWSKARTREEIVSAKMQLPASDRDGLLAQWIFSPGYETDYIVDSGGKFATNLYLCNVNNTGFGTLKLPFAKYTAITAHPLAN